MVSVFTVSSFVAVGLSFYSVIQKLKEIVSTSSQGRDMSHPWPFGLQAKPGRPIYCQCGQYRRSLVGIGCGGLLPGIVFIPLTHANPNKSKIEAASPLNRPRPTPLG